MTASWTPWSTSGSSRIARAAAAGEADLLRRRFYVDQTQAEIAAETGIALGTVKARMRSGLETLRTMLDEERR